MIKLDKEYVRNLIKQLAEKIKKNKYVFIVLLLGLVLLLIPTKDKEEETKKEVPEESSIGFSLYETESRLNKILSEIDGAGDVSVMLTVENDGEKVLALDTESSDEVSGGDGTEEVNRTKSSKTVIISTGSGTEDVVTVEYIYPKYIGAVVVAEGADSSRVKLDITEAVAAVTGLSTDKIKVIKKTGS